MKWTDLHQFEKGEPPNCLLIVSADRFDREQAIARALAAFSGEVTRLDGETVTAKEIVRELGGGSLFEERTLCLIRSCEKLRKEVTDYLAKAVATLPPSCGVVVAGEKLAANSALYKAFLKVGGVVDLPTEKPWAAEKSRPDWVGIQARRLGKEMAPDGVRLLVSRIGVEKEALYREVEKLAAYVGERAEIGRGDVESLTSYAAPPAMWELGGALFALDAARSLSVARRLIGGGMALPPLLAYLRRRIEEGIQLCSGSHPPQLMGRRLEVATSEANRFGMRRMVLALSTLAETELLLRSGGGDDLILIQRFISKVVS